MGKCLSKHLTQSYSVLKPVGRGCIVTLGAETRLCFIVEFSLFESIFSVFSAIQKLLYGFHNSKCLAVGKIHFINRILNVR